MSPTARVSAEKTTLRPSGEKSGDSGSSTMSRSISCSISRVTTFWMTSDLYLFRRTK